MVSLCFTPGLYLHDAVMLGELRNGVQVEAEVTASWLR